MAGDPSNHESRRAADKQRAALRNRRRRPILRSPGAVEADRCNRRDGQVSDESLAFFGIFHQNPGINKAFPVAGEHESDTVRCAWHSTRRF